MISKYRPQEILLNDKGEKKNHRVKEPRKTHLDAQSEHHQKWDKPKSSAPWRDSRLSAQHGS